MEMTLGLALGCCGNKKRSVFSPIEISNLELWLDATDSSTISLRDSTFVTGWSDKSGQGNDFTQSVLDDQPTMGTNDIFFTLLKHMIAGSNYIFSDGTGPHNGLSIIALAKSDSNTNLRYLFDFGGFQTSYNLAHSKTPGTGGGECPAQITAWADTGVDNTYHMPSLVIDFDGSTITYRMDGVQLNQTAIIITDITAANIGEAPVRGATTGPMTVGGHSVTGSESARSFFGTLKALLIYSKKLTSTELGQVNDYLASLP